MHLATVVGRVWATQKERTLEGLRLLVVQPWVPGRRAGEDGAETMVAVDTIGADVGERVLVVHGRAARYAIGRGHDVGFQTAIVGIVDAAVLAGGERVGQTAAGDRPGDRSREEDA
ncbi:MAG: EutN/CcmL family microcompartment protein [Planctomycetota bacterium]